MESEEQANTTAGIEQNHVDCLDFTPGKGNPIVALNNLQWCSIFDSAKTDLC